MRRSEARKQRRKALRGIPVSPGFAVGHVCVLLHEIELPEGKIGLDREAIHRELERLHVAIDQTREHFFRLKRRVSEQMGPEAAEIVDVQLLLLDDQYFIDEIERRLTDHRISLEEVIQQVSEAAATQLATSENAYLRERARDIRDIARRVMRQLNGTEQTCSIEGESDEMIIVAEELTPSLTWQLDRHKLKGFVTERGGKTSHGAILARSLGVPLVSGVLNAVNELHVGGRVLVDGSHGRVVLYPTREEIQAQRRRAATQTLTSKDEDALVRLPAVTRDGQEVRLYANVANEADVEEAIAVNAAGIGLFRTELYFLVGDRFPNEEEQLEHYRAAVEKMAPRPVTIRTLDLGGDKYSPIPESEREPNPYLGWRAIRVSLQQPGVFREQVRAILRAGAHGPVRIMLPLVSSVKEVRDARLLLEQAKDELRRDGLAFAEDTPFGVMVEVPSAALNASSLAREVDFLSVGTNDLIQYTLAVDRGNERVSDLYEPLDPAILKLLEMVQSAATAGGKEVSLCGEMAGDATYLSLLVGLGYRQLSMSPRFLLRMKKVVRELETKTVADLAHRALVMDTAEKIRRMLVKASPAPRS
jgi:phosphotransferase system enzyme I (PtsI)